MPWEHEIVYATRHHDSHKHENYCIVHSQIPGKNPSVRIMVNNDMWDFILTSLCLLVPPDYAPIQLASSSIVKLVVDDYSLFYDLVQRSGLVNAGPAESRKRRSLTDTIEYQLVEFEFILQRNSSGTLLYSETNSAIHRLQVRVIWQAVLLHYFLIHLSDIWRVGYSPICTQRRGIHVGDRCLDKQLTHDCTFLPMAGYHMHMQPRI